MGRKSFGQNRVTPTAPGLHDERIRTLAKDLGEGNSIAQVCAATEILELALPSFPTNRKSQADAIVECGALRSLLYCLEYATHEKVIQSCAEAIWGICSNITNIELLVHSKCVEVLERFVIKGVNVSPPPDLSNAHCPISCVVCALHQLSRHDKILEQMQSNELLNAIAYVVAHTTANHTKVISVLLLGSAFNNRGLEEDSRYAAKKILGIHRVTGMMRAYNSCTQIAWL